MSLNGQRDGFQAEDLIAFAQAAGLKKTKAMTLLKEVADSVKNWRRYAAEAGVSTHDKNRIEKAFRIHLAP